MAVAYKGGVCQCCKYNKYIGALEFHHINPDENTKIGTGMILEISLNNEKKEYTLVVIGDCNGSGTTNVADLTKLMMSRAESLADNKDESKILKGSYAEAVDLNNDGKISVADITLLCKFIAENK